MKSHIDRLNKSSQYHCMVSRHSLIGKPDGFQSKAVRETESCRGAAAGIECRLRGGIVGLKEYFGVVRQHTRWISSVQSGIDQSCSFTVQQGQRVKRLKTQHVLFVCFPFFVLEHS